MAVNADQLFVVSTLSRNDIYDDLQNYLEDLDCQGVFGLTLDDLTDEVCKEYTERLGDIYSAFLVEADEEEACTELIVETLEYLGFECGSFPSRK